MTVWEQRWHPLRGEWVLFTSHRSGRPWLGARSGGVTSAPTVDYDPTCALCPGNLRLSGERNADYSGAWWFTNDLPTFGPDAPPIDTPAPGGGVGLYRRRPATGTAEVICHHPAHQRSLGELTDDEIGAVAALWRERTVALAARPEVDGVLVFENRGTLVGTSNPHPHSQIYAGGLVYGTFDRESSVAAEHHASTGRHLGLDILEGELASGRVVVSGDSFVAVVPWFARYAYEIIILPRRPVASLADLDADETADLGRVLGSVVRTYDGLWGIEMPYVLAVHQAPSDGRPTASYPFHVEMHPPLRTPDTMKFLAGPEIGGGSMTNERDPDETAAELIAAHRRVEAAR